MFFLQFKTSVLSNNRFAKLFKETSFSRATMVMRFPAKTNTGCPKAPRDFPPRKDGILHPASGCLGTPLPLPQSLYGQTYADVTTKISRIDRLPNLLSSGSPLIYYTSNNENENLRFEILCLAFANFYRLTAVKPSLDKP